MKYENKDEINDNIDNIAKTIQYLSKMDGNLYCPTPGFCL